MPFLKIVTNVPESKIPTNFGEYLTGLLAGVLSKPVAYCSVQIMAGQIVAFGGAHEPSAILTCMSVGRQGVRENDTISARLTHELESALGVLSYNCYVQFVDPKPSDICYNLSESD